MTSNTDNEKYVTILNELIEREYAGVIRYSHYSLMVVGYNRIPIQKWFREQSVESLQHAEEIGELITTLGGHPSLKVASLSESFKHSIQEILSESQAHEQAQIAGLYKLLETVAGKNVVLEEFARKMIVSEETHVSEVRKMLQRE